MGLNLFKRKQVATPEPEVIEKIKEVFVEKEVPVYSKFTFAHDNNVILNKYYLNIEKQVRYADLADCDEFAIKSETASNIDDGLSVYFTFKMPDVIPATKLVTPKKVLCTGSMVICEDSEIIEVNNQHVCDSLEEMVNAGVIEAIPVENTCVICLEDDVITKKLIEDDKVDYFTFVTSVVLESVLDI